MAGLPGSGKSALAESLASALRCAIVSVDPVEAAMWAAGIDPAQPTGVAAYGVARAIAREQLELGLDVVVDAVNDVEASREQWKDLARVHGTRLVFVEVHCDDRIEHRRRLEARRRSIPGFAEPTWSSVEARRAAFEDWDEPRIRVDAMRDHRANVAAVLEKLVSAQVNFSAQGGASAGDTP